MTASIETAIVRKRNSKIVPLDEVRIFEAIKNAFASAENLTLEGDELPRMYMLHVRSITDAVVNIVLGKLSRGNVDISVEDIQDIVEHQLMAAGHYEVARKYIIYREEHNKARNVRLQADNKAVEDYILVDRYARYNAEKKRRETYEEAVERVRDMHIRRYPLITDELIWAFDQVKQKKCLPSMRSMQFAGPAIETNHGRMYNCSYGICDRSRFFQEAFYLLLCGTGVGLSVEFEHVEKLPSMAPDIDDSTVIHFTVPDTIEGWGDSLGALIDSYVGGYLVEFNYSEIRPKGAFLKTSGGRAPGHVPLRVALVKIRSILDKAVGRRLKPIECYDIVMHAADAVIAGGIRRSATICLFSPDDGEMMNAKTGNWFELNPQRGRSNNSVKLIRDEVTKAQFMRTFAKQKEWGEPGFYFSDDLYHGTNPCCEIGMMPVLFEQDRDGNEIVRTGWQFCNLTEINGAKLLTEEDFRNAVKATSIIGTCQAGFTDFPYLGDTTERICRKEALLGMSITGMMDSPDVALNPEIQTKMAQYAIEINQEISSKIGIEAAARLTCVKPAGSTSLLLGTASGIHPRHAKRYFRRVQANKKDPVYQFFKKHNPEACEDSVWSANKTDEVITFCMEAPEGAIIKNHVGALEFLEKVKSTQQNWVIKGTAKPESSKGLLHNVSNTVVVKPEEWDDVADFIWKNREFFTGISLLASTGDKAYPQAPHEEISTEEDEIHWNHLVSKFAAVDYKEMIEEEDMTDLQGEIACAGGNCENV